MKAPTLTKSPVSQSKRTSTKRAAVALATCPVNGKGWCPYPFSPAQLEKRLRAKALEQQNASKTVKAPKVRELV